MARGQLVLVQCPGVVGADCSVVLGSDLSCRDRACPGPERRYVLPEPRRASALVHHQVSCVFRLVLQRVHRHVWVVWHLRSHQQGGAAGESTGPGLACPHLHYHPLGPELRLFRRSSALFVRGHQPHWCWRVGPWAKKLGPRHIRVRFLVFTGAHCPRVRREDVREGCRWGGIGCPDGSSLRPGGVGRPRSPAGHCARPA